jgi:hypothetical protein
VRVGDVSEPYIKGIGRFTVPCWTQSNATSKEEKARDIIVALGTYLSDQANAHGKNPEASRHSRHCSKPF